jgi:signal transduction histidine kinase
VTRLLVVAAAAIGLILFVAFIVSRLLRTPKRGMSIRMQVFLALAVIVGTFAFGLGLMVIDRIEARAVRVASQAARDEADALSGFIAGELDRSGGSVHEIAKKLEIERRRGADLRLRLLDVNGSVLFPERAEPEPEQGYVAVEAPLSVGGRRVGAVRVVKPTIVMRRLLEDFAPTVLVISLVLGAAAALAAAWIGRAIARPIEALSDFAERVSLGESSAPSPVVTGREVMRLRSSVDSMRRQLEGRPFVETFAADLSHELKNPVAAVRASAEVLEEGAIDEPEQARLFVKRIREATQRIERLLTELLSLARIEARGAEGFAPVELGEVARVQLEALGEGAERVELRLIGDTRVRGEAVWLGRAISNLVENALIHSTPHTPVELRIAHAAGRVEVCVENRGAVHPHVQRTLFRRFVSTRADKGGSGLGLAIVRAVAEAHGGMAELVAPGPPATRFRLDLPAARAGGVVAAVRAKPEIPLKAPAKSRAKANLPETSTNLGGNLARDSAKVP